MDAARALGVFSLWLGRIAGRKGRYAVLNGLLALSANPCDKAGVIRERVDQLPSRRPHAQSRADSGIVSDKGIYRQSDIAGIPVEQHRAGFPRSFMGRWRYNLSKQPFSRRRVHKHPCVAGPVLEPAAESLGRHLDPGGRSNVYALSRSSCQSSFRPSAVAHTRGLRCQQYDQYE